MPQVKVRAASGEMVAVQATEGAARPYRVTLSQVRHTASNNRLTRIGLQVRVTMTDDTLVYCSHTSGHRTREAAKACAITLVDRLNRQAGIDPKTYKEA